MTGEINGTNDGSRSEFDKSNMSERMQECVRQHRERYREVISIAKKFGLDDMLPIIEDGWGEKGMFRYGPESLLASLLYACKHNESVKDFERFCTRVGDMRERALSWFDFNGFSDCRQIYWTTFSGFMESYAKAMVKREGEGYTDLQFLMPWIVGMRQWRRPLSSACEEAISNDSWSALSILKDLGVMKKFTKPVVRDILRADNAGNIAERLILEGKDFQKYFTPRGALLLLCSACPNDAKCVRLGKLLVEKDPDACRRPDINGYTPLVYTFFAHRRTFIYDINKYNIGKRRRAFERFLMDNGCNPDHEDRFGLSWRLLEPVAKKYISCW